MGSVCRLSEAKGDSLWTLEFRKVILRCLLLSLALAAGAGVLAVLLPIDDVLVRVMLSGLVTSVAAGLLMLLSLMIDRRRTRGPDSSAWPP